MERSPQDASSGRMPVIDDDAIEALRELGGEDEPGLVAELIEAFLEDAPRRIGDMRAALASGDLELLERAAHTLKSSAANLGARVLSGQAQALEAAVRAGSRSGEDFTHLASRCEAALGEAEQALRRIAD